MQTKTVVDAPGCAKPRAVERALDANTVEELEARRRRYQRIAISLWVWLLTGIFLLVWYRVPRSPTESYILGPVCYVSFVAMCWLLVLETYWIRPKTFWSWLGRLVSGVVWMAALCLTLSVGVRILLKLVL